jgi:hypothetical protein
LRRRAVELRGTHNDDCVDRARLAIPGLIVDCPHEDKWRHEQDNEYESYGPSNPSPELAWQVLTRVEATGSLCGLSSGVNYEFTSAILDAYPVRLVSEQNDEIPFKVVGLPVADRRQSWRLGSGGLEFGFGCWLTCGDGLYLAELALAYQRTQHITDNADAK